MKKDIGITGLAFPNPVLVVGTYDSNGNPNVVTLAWGGVAASDPPAIAISVRPSRHSYEALMRTRAFTVNLPSVRYVAETDFFGLVSGSRVNKCAVTGLTPVRGNFVDAPYIAEFPIVMECAVSHTLELGSHTLFVGEIKSIKADEELLDDEGKIIWEAAGILTTDAVSKEYRAPGEVVGKSYQTGKKYVSR